MKTKMREYKGLQWIKVGHVVFAFFSPMWLVLSLFPNVISKGNLSALGGLGFTLLHLTVFLLAAYYYQDIYVDDHGLMIEFLWTKIRVHWEDIIEVKYVWGLRFLREEKRPLVVVVKSLTPFHRVFGVLYALSLKPAFIIDVTIDDFQSLKKNIQKRIILPRWKL